MARGSSEVIGYLFPTVFLATCVTYNMLRSIIFVLIISVTHSCVTNKYPSNKTIQIDFDTETKNALLCELSFSNPKTDSTLSKLRMEYNLDKLINVANSDIEKTLILLNWTNGKWNHNAYNEPEKSDALSILKEAENGKEFRCVEYGIVLSEVLNSIGIPTRTLGLKTRDVETVKYGAGHVVSEAYIPDQKKWVFADAQINYIPFLSGKPLNAIEYQSAIINHKEQIELKNINGTLSKKEALEKINWVSKYLYYFDVKFDNSENSVGCNGKSRLMLVPMGAKKPIVFQIDRKIDNCIYTNNVMDFYKEPIIK